MDLANRGEISLAHSVVLTHSYSSQEEGLFGWEGYIDFHSILPTESPCEA